MAFPSKAPQPKFKWPSVWEDWQWSFIEWAESRQPVPDPTVFTVSEKPGGVYFSLVPAAIQKMAGSSVFPLQISDASTGGSAKVRVRLGYVAGIIADAGMTDPGDSPPFKLTLPAAAGSYYVLAKVTVGYSAGIWSASACEIASPAPASITANDATTIYVNLGTAEVISDGSGGWKCAAGTVTPAVGGSQWVARVGSSSSYVDANGRI